MTPPSPCEPVLCLYRAHEFRTGAEVTGAKVIRVRSSEQIIETFEAAMRDDQRPDRLWFKERLTFWEMTAYWPRSGRATF